jgi:hypothetical protein
MENDNNITQLLMEILKFSGENGFLFEIKNNEDEPYFKIEEVPEKTVTISVPDFKDENLFSMLEENFEKLKNLSK